MIQNLSLKLKKTVSGDFGDEMIVVAGSDNDYQDNSLQTSAKKYFDKIRF